MMLTVTRMDKVIWNIAYTRPISPCEMVKIAQTWSVFLWFTYISCTKVYQMLNPITTEIAIHHLYIYIIYYLS